MDTMSILKELSAVYGETEAAGMIGVRQSTVWRWLHTGMKMGPAMAKLINLAWVQHEKNMEHEVKSGQI